MNTGSGDGGHGAERRIDKAADSAAPSDLVSAYAAIDEIYEDPDAYLDSDVLPFWEDDPDEQPEEDSDDVGTNKHSMSAKSRHVLRKLELGAFRYRDGEKWICPFCNRLVHGTRISVEQHAASIATSGTQKKGGHFKAKHAAFSWFLQNLP